MFIEKFVYVINLKHNDIYLDKSRAYNKTVISISIILAHKGNMKWLT